MKLTLDGHDYEVEVEDGAVTVNGTRYQVGVKGHGLTRNATVNGRAIRVDLTEPEESGERTANVDGKVWRVQTSGSARGTVAAARRTAPAAGSTQSARPGRTARGAVTAQMTGRVLRINVNPGEKVEEGAPLLILEAMKMENEIRSPRAGVVKEVAVAVGDRVNSGDTLVVLED